MVDALTRMERVVGVGTFSVHVYTVFLEIYPHLVTEGSSIQGGKVDVLCSMCSCQSKELLK